MEKGCAGTYMGGGDLQLMQQSVYVYKRYQIYNCSTKKTIYMHGQMEV